MTVTVAGRLLSTRGVAVYFLLALGSVALVGASVRSAASMRQTPHHGLELATDEVVSADARWAPLLPGDRLLAVNHIRPDDPISVARLLQETPDEGGVATLTFARGQEVIDVSAPTEALPWYHAVSLGVRVGVAALCMLISLIAFLLRPGFRVTWLFLLYGIDLGAELLVILPLVHHPDLANRVMLASYITAMSVGLHFFTEFPRPIGWLVRNPRRALWYYLPLPPVYLFLLFAGWPGNPALWGLVESAVYLTTVASGFFATGVVIYMWRRATKTDRLLQGQYRDLFVGLFFGLVIPAIWHMLRMVLGFWQAKWIVHLNTVPILLYSGMTGYALVRHNLMMADRFTASVVGYAVTLGVVVIGFTAALLGVSVLLGRAAAARSPEVLVAVTMAATVAFLPIYRRLKKRVDRWFLRDRAGQGALTDELRELTRVIRMGNRDAAFGAAASAIRVLGGERGELWTLDEDGESFRAVRSDGIPRERPAASIARDTPLGLVLLSNTSGGLPGLSPRALPAGAQVELLEQDLAMVTPVVAHGVVAGFVGIGRKRSGGRYAEEELSFLAMVAAQVGLAMERSTEESAHVGRYRIERRLGVGGMAEVFLAWQVGIGGFERKVALKRPLPALADHPKAIAMFLDEARVAAQLVHRNIVQVYEVDKSDVGYYIAMEFVDGPSLRSVLRAAEAAGQAAPVPVAAAIAAAVLDALEYAHAASDGNGRPLKLVHRDVTPSNVLLSRQGDVKLVDFGIARTAAKLDVTRTGVVKGTLQYMAPEQAAGQPVDARADLFSAGVVLAEMVTGARTFPDGAASTDAPALDGAPAQLQAMLRRALAVEPAERFASAAEMRAALLAAIAPATPADAAAIGAWHRALVAPGAAEPAEAPSPQASATGATVTTPRSQDKKTSA